MFDQSTPPPAPPASSPTPAGTPPANLPLASDPLLTPDSRPPTPDVEDMFAGVKEPMLPPSGPAESVPPIGEQAARGGLKKILIIAGVAVVVVIIGVVSWLTFFRGGEEQLVSETLDTETPAAETPTPVAEPESPAPTSATGGSASGGNTTVETPSQPATDTDGDGISDEEEGRLGTNVQSADTDNDGLSDGDEVRIYKTDPKNPDTDGDTFLDGQEVRSGFDPNAKGKRLFEVPPAQ